MATADQVSVSQRRLSNDAVQDEVAGASSGGQEEVPREFECSICIKILLMPVTTPCGHNFCKGCIEEALTYRPMCPLCRAPLLLSTFSDNDRATSSSRSSSRSTLCVNTLLQQLLEAHYPRAMRKRREDERRLREEEDALEAAAGRGGHQPNSNSEEEHPRFQVQRMPVLFMPTDRLHRRRASQIQQRTLPCRGGASAFECVPLMVEEEVTLHIQEESDIRLVQLAMQGARYIGLAYPPVSGQAVGVELPCSAEVSAAAATEGSLLWSRGESSQLREDVSSERRRDGAESTEPNQSQRGNDAESHARTVGELRIPLSREEGIFGCAVQIVQHTPLPPQSGEESSGRCLIRCLNKGRCRLSSVFEWSYEAEQGPRAFNHADEGTSNAEESLRNRAAPSLPSTSPFAIGVFIPFSDKPESREFVRDETESTGESFEGEMPAATPTWDERPLTRDSVLREELRIVSEFVAFETSRRGSTGGRGGNWKRKAEHRCSQICLEGLERQLQQAGDIAQRLFSSKFGRIPTLNPNATEKDLEYMSFFFCKVVVAKPAVKWKWFLLTDTLERLMAVSRVIVDAQWMNILALRQVCSKDWWFYGVCRQCCRREGNFANEVECMRSSSPQSSLSRFLLLHDFNSNFWLFGLFLIVLVACRLFSALSGDHEL